MPRTPIEYSVSGYIFGDHLEHEMTLTGALMEMKDIAKLLDSEKIIISNIEYHTGNFLCTKYLTINYDKYLKADDTHYDIINFPLTVMTCNDISLNTIIHEMSYCDVFMKYFTTRLRQNLPEIIIYGGNDADT